MRPVFEALRLAFDQGLSQREIGRALGPSQSTTNEYPRRVRASGLPWPVPPELDEAGVEARLFARDAAPTVGPPEARLADDPCGAEAEGRHAAAALDRVQGDGARRLSVHAVLPALSRVGRHHRARLAPSLYGRREVFHRSYRADVARRRHSFARTFRIASRSRVSKQTWQRHEARASQAAAVLSRSLASPQARSMTPRAVASDAACELRSASSASRSRRPLSRTHQQQITVRDHVPRRRGRRSPHARHAL